MLWLRLAALPAMLLPLGAGPLARLAGSSVGLARLGLLFAALGLLALAAVSDSLIGIAIASFAFVGSIAAAVPAMITLFSSAAGSRQAGGMAICGLVLFIGATIGPIRARTGLSFSVLPVVLAALLGVAVLSLSIAGRLQLGRSNIRPGAVADDGGSCA